MQLSCHPFRIRGLQLCRYLARGPLLWCPSRSPPEWQLHAPFLSMQYPGVRCGSRRYDAVASLFVCEDGSVVRFRVAAGTVFIPKRTACRWVHYTGWISVRPVGCHTETTSLRWHGWCFGCAAFGCACHAVSAEVSDAFAAPQSFMPADG